MRSAAERSLLEKARESPDSPGSLRATQRDVRPKRSLVDSFEKALLQEHLLGVGRERRELASSCFHPDPHDTRGAARRETPQTGETHRERLTTGERARETPDQIVHPRRLHVTEKPKRDVQVLGRNPPDVGVRGP
jgi:hypothetical protein